MINTSIPKAYEKNKEELKKLVEVLTKKVEELTKIICNGDNENQCSIIMQNSIIGKMESLNKNVTVTIHTGSLHYDGVSNPILFNIPKAPILPITVPIVIESIEDMKKKESGFATISTDGNVILNTVPEYAFTITFTISYLTN